MNRTSVIIPAYRAAGTVRRAVESVLRQTSPAHEVIVVDDGSPDDIAAVLEGFGPRVSLIRQANAGAGAARNTGIDAASGDWIAFLDADDEWAPDRLEQQHQAAKTETTIGMVVGRFELRQANAATGTVNGWGSFAVGRPLTLNGDLAFRFAAMCWTGTVLVRRDVIADQRFRTDLRTAEDRELWYRIISRTRVLAIDAVVAIQHVTPGSLSTTDIDDDCANMMRVVELHAADLTPGERRAWRIELSKRRAAVHLSNGNTAAARRAAWQRLRLAPLSVEAWYIWLKALFWSRA